MDKKKQSFAEKLKKIVYNPYVRKTSKFAGSLLETMSLVDLKNPLTIATGIFSIVDSGVEAFDVLIPGKLDQYAEQHDLSEKYSYLAKIVVSSGLLEDYPSKSVIVHNKLAVKQMEFEFGSFYYVENIDTGYQFNDELDRICPWYYTTMDFSYDKLFSKIWEKYEGGIFLSKINSEEEEHSSLRTLRLHKLSTNDLIYIGDSPDLESFVKNLDKFRAKGRSRSYMLAGVPGTGKTSFAIVASKRVTGRILKIDPSVARQIGSGDFEFLVKNLSPESIIFDDFDRAAADATHLLFLLENIKQQFPNIVIFSTVNNYEDLDPALRRPGRFDRTMWFELPNEDERRELAEYYLSFYGIGYDDEQLNAVIDLTDDMSPAYIRELCIRIETQGWQEIENIIDEFKRTLGQDDEDDGEEEEDDES